MSILLPEQLSLSPAFTKRQTKRRLIEEHFLGNIGTRLSSAELHMTFGTSLRTRISEINRDSGAAITIHNDITVRSGGSEKSTYWAEPRNTGAA